jgi:hypothetical protein
MGHDSRPGDEARTRKSAADYNDAVVGPKDRVIAPVDGSIAWSDDLISVFCASCQRWIDCYEGIPPKVALDRHRHLIH